MTERSVAHATFTIERTYKASPTCVFRAFADPAILDRWFVKADGWPITEFTFDFKVGGRGSGRFSPDGKEVYVNETVYQDIVPDRRIVWAYTMARGEVRFSASLATVELLPDDGGTRLVMTEQGAFFDGGDQPANREEGWVGLLDALGRELDRKPQDA